MKRQTTAKRKASSASKAIKHTYYHKDGSIYGKGSLKAGKMHGYWEWYRKDGSRMRSGYFENGEQVGEWTTYDPSGKPLKTTIMKKK
jgi:antitoxin component YwqK of YwqJK toxin-antitoxin module